jgi:hypothetical protein
LTRIARTIRQTYIFGQASWLSTKKQQQLAFLTTKNNLKRINLLDAWADVSIAASLVHHADHRTTNTQSHGEEQSCSLAVDGGVMQNLAFLDNALVEQLMALWGLAAYDMLPDRSFRISLNCKACCQDLVLSPFARAISIPSLPQPGTSFHHHQLKNSIFGLVDVAVIVGWQSPEYASVTLSSLMTL